MADTALCLGENITLLRKTCDKPIKPTHNELDSIENDVGRVLQLKQELAVVNCLSYLASYSDLPGDVMALCIEERVDHQGLIVSLATNNELVSRLQTGLQSIAEILVHQAHDIREDHVDRLLRAVVAHGRQRVMRRMGVNNSNIVTTAMRLQIALGHAAKTRPKIKKTLRPLFDLSSDLSRLTGIYQKIPHLGQDDFAHSTLMSILFVSAKLWKDHQTDLQNILGLISPKDMEPTAIDSLKSRLGHLGHYVPTAKSLLRYAKGFSIFRSIEIRPRCMKPMSLSQALKKPPVDKTGLLSRYLQQPKKLRGPARMSAMKSLIALHRRDLVSLQKDMRDSIAYKDAHRCYKVHAEIQLLACYDSMEVPYPPRVLKSSKDACFLCDLFIKVHGRFYIPKTHGRVYDMWMLPDLPQTDFNISKQQAWIYAVGKFNTAIEELLMSVASKGKTIMVDPRESGIFSIISESTHRSHVNNSELNEPVAVRSNASHRPSTGASERELKDLEIQNLESEDEVPLENIATLPTPPRSPISPPPEMMQHEHDGEQIAQAIEQSQGIDFLISDEEDNSTPIFYLQIGLEQPYVFEREHISVRFHTPKVHIEVSNLQAEALASRPVAARLYPRHGNIRVTALWLSPDETLEALQESGGPIADLLEPWWTLELGEGSLFDSGLLLRKGNHVIRLKASYVENGNQTDARKSGE